MQRKVTISSVFFFRIPWNPCSNYGWICTHRLPILPPWWWPLKLMPAVRSCAVNCWVITSPWSRLGVGTLCIWITCSSYADVWWTLWTSRHIPIHHCWVSMTMKFGHNDFFRMNDWCFRPQFCNVRLHFAWVQPGLTRWISVWIMPQVQD